MFKTDVTYTNFRGEKVTEALRFNLSESELQDLADADRSFSQDYLSWVIEQQNVKEMFNIIRKLIAVSYGVMSEDGRAFRKRDDDVYDFLHSAAYDQFIDNLLDEETGEALMSEFVINVFPAKFSDAIRGKIKEEKAALTVAK